MTVFSYLLLGVLSLSSVFSPSAGAAPTRRKLRVIATTDGEIDDRCSMIRFLLCANEWQVLGIIHSASKYHWKGDARHRPHRWADESWLDRQLDAYERVYPNLKANDPDYPTPDYLRRQVFEGNVAYEGDMERPTPGSNRIVQVLLDPDPSPVWLLAWGGANTIARALKTIEEKHPDRVAETSRKAKLFLIAVQDDTMDAYLLKHWPKAQLILCTAYGAIAYGWRGIMVPEQQAFFTSRWMRANILSGHGPLCALYEANNDGSFRSEGDSPSFLHLVPVGLGAHESPTFGGWGGRYEWQGGKFVSARDSCSRYKSILRWAAAFQNDFAARADWCVKPFSQCNHPPAVVCNGDPSTAVLHRPVRPGDKVKLDAAGTSDPDGDKLTYDWWVYKDAGTYWNAPVIQGRDRPTAALVVPREASGRTIHVILEVTDNGVPPLTRYRRVVVHVGGAPQPRPEDKYLTTPLTHLGGPSLPGRWSFYRGVNLNGPALVIDGNHWAGDDAPNFKCADRGLNSPQVTLRPPTDAARAQMIHSFRWSTHPKVILTEAPAGAYAVYAYLWEDNNPENLNVYLNGRLVERDYCSGVAGEWHRAGPWIVTVTGGTIKLTASGGAANISGIEVWKKQAE